MEKRQHVADIVFILALFCVFAILALLVVVLGANVYKEIAGDMTANYNSRTSMAYLTEKIRQSDLADSISIQSMDGEDALVLSRTVDGTVYETWVFAQSGSLREMTVRQGDDVASSAAQPIVEAADMELSREKDGLIRIRITDPDGTLHENAVFPKSAGMV